MEKEDYIWLERNTEIANVCRNLEECAATDTSFKIYRDNHLDRLRRIFHDYPQSLYRDKRDNLLCLTVKGYSLNDLFNAACENGAELILDTTNETVRYICADKKKFQRIFRRSPAKLLENLPNRRKLNILFAFSSGFFIDDAQDKRLKKTIAKHSDKFLALLKLKIPEKFLTAEAKKIDLITGEIVRIPDIHSKIRMFPKLPFAEQKKLINTVCRLTAKANNIKAPHVFYLSEEQLNKDNEFNCFLNTDALTSDRDILFSKDRFNATSGIETLSTAFHETCHIAQMYADYKDFPEMEEILGAKLLYLSSYKETYLSSPPEMLAYPLEKAFIQRLEDSLNIKNKQSFYESEYAITCNYLQKSLRRTY